MKELDDKMHPWSHADVVEQQGYSKMEVRLLESQRGGIWKWFGDKILGGGHDQLMPSAQFVDQRWYIDGKRAQVVVGADRNGQLIKAWTVHVDMTSGRPVFSKSD